MEVANVIFSEWEAMSGREERRTVWLITNSSARIIEGMNSREDIIETYLIKDFITDCILTAGKGVNAYRLIDVLIFGW